MRVRLRHDEGWAPPSIQRLEADLLRWHELGPIQVLRHERRNDQSFPRPPCCAVSLPGLISEADILRPSSSVGRGVDHWVKLSAAVYVDAVELYREQPVGRPEARGGKEEDADKYDEDALSVETRQPFQRRHVAPSFEPGRKCEKGRGTAGSP